MGLKKEEGRRKKEEGRKKKEERRRKKEEGRRKKEEKRRKKKWMWTQTPSNCQHRVDGGVLNS